jgi:hypothetical protein
MTFTYDPTTPRGQVRLLCTDVDSANQIFSDAEIDAFLTLEANDVRYGAAQALDTIASQQALVLKVIRLLDLQTDGAKVAAELRARAVGLREQSDADASFDVVEMVPNDFAARERIWKEFLRGGG